MNWQWLRKKRVLIPLALLIVYALFGFFALPGILRGQILQGIRTNLKREARLDRVRVNPLIFSLTLEGFELRDPDQTAFVAFDRLYVDLQLSSLVRWAVTLREFRLDRPRVNVRLMPDGKPNFEDMLPKEEGEPPRLVIGRFQIKDGSVHMANLMSADPEEGTLAPLDLTLDNFTTIPQKEGNYRIVATDPGGGAWQWTGDLTFEPMHSAGVLEISGSRLRSWWEIVKHRVGPEITEGRLACRLEYSADVKGDSVLARVRESSLAITGLAMRERGGDRDLIELDTLAITGVEVRYPEQSAAIGRVLVAGTSIRAWLNPDTTLNLQAMVAQRSPAAATAVAVAAAGHTRDTTAAAQGSAPEWLLSLDELAIRDLGIDFEDRTVQPAFAVAVDPVNLTLRNVNSRRGASFDLASDVTIAEKGRLDLHGKVAAQPAAADVEVRLTDLPLAIFQPYVNPIAKLQIVSGTLGADGAVRFREAKSTPEVGFRGSVVSRGLLTRDRRSNERFVAWKAVEVKAIDASTSHLRIGAVKLTEPFARLLINQDRTTNVQEILGLPTLDSTGAPIEAQVATSSKPAKKGKAKKAQPKTSETLAAMRTSAETMMPVQLGKIEVVNGSADFADLSLILPFAARIEQLAGSITQMSSSSGSPAGVVVLDGRLQPSGTAHVGGNVNPWAQDTVLDLRVVFNDLNMPSLTPYTGNFLGREIDKGRMSLDLGYRLQGRHLVGENKVVLDQLELGERVDSPEATRLPVGLAIAILKDREGKIDLDVPVEGDLDDPKFRIGKVIWNFIMSLLGKVATAPFALLGALFGGGGTEELGHVAFEPGASALPADQHESVDKLAGALAERPQLNLEVRGTTNDSLDAVAIRKAKFAALAGERMVANPKKYGSGIGYSPRLLEELYVERFGKHGLSDLKERFKTTAGELDASDPRCKAGSRKAVVNEPAMHAAIEETMTALQTADPADLLSLANARAAAVRSRLVAQGVDEARVYLLDPAPGHVEDGRIRMDLTLTD